MYLYNKTAVCTVIRTRGKFVRTNPFLKNQAMLRTYT